MAVQGQTAADYASNPQPFNPEGYTRTGGNSSSDVYVDPKTGETIIVAKDGRVITTIPAGQSNDFTLSDVTGKIREATDAVGITTPDPHKSPEFQRILDAADAFRDFYRQDRGFLDQARGLDLDTIATLRDAAEGRTPSAAENLMRRGIDQGSSQALGLAATLGGANPGMALREGLQAKATATARSAAEMAALRAKEMEAARALLARQTGSARQTEAANAGQTGTTYEHIVGAPFGAEERANASNQALAGRVWGAIAESDIRAKTNIQPNPAMADDFLRSISNPGPQSFEYKNPGVNKPAGQQMGVMAQDLPQRDVMTGPDGKKWISANVIGDVLAGLGRVNQKVDAVSGDGPRAMPAGVDPRQYAAAMDYVTSPGRDVSPMARAAGGMPPMPRSRTDDELGIAGGQIDPSIINAFLAGMGMSR